MILEEQILEEAKKEVKEEVKERTTEEKTAIKLAKIHEFFNEKGFGYLKEDLDDFFQERTDIVEKIQKLKFNKIELFAPENSNSIGFTLSDVQVEFFVEMGSDEDGPWFEATAEILDFSKED